jgi:hypothetical protein
VKDPRKNKQKNLPEAGSPMRFPPSVDGHGRKTMRFLASVEKQCDKNKPFQIKGRCFRFCRNGEEKTRSTADDQSFEHTGLCDCLEGTDQESARAEDEFCGVSSALLETSKQ